MKCSEGTKDASVRQLYSIRKDLHSANIQTIKNAAVLTEIPCSDTVVHPGAMVVHSFLNVGIKSCITKKIEMTSV